MIGMRELVAFGWRVWFSVLQCIG